MASFWIIVNKVIRGADVLLLLLDSRLVKESYNEEVVDKAKETNKPLIFVFTKCDLVDTKIVEQYKKKFRPAVFVSAKMHFGTTILREKILIAAKKANIKGMIKVGVLGYPNVGKSSLINAMVGRGSAPTSSLSGHTKAVQNIRTSRIMFLDTPGVLPYKEKDEVAHTAMGAIDYAKSKDPDIMVMALMDKFPGRIEKYYEVKVKEDKEESLEEIALKKNIIKKGNEADVMRLARLILRDWQKGKIKS